ncbi:hypothetical protein J6TS2_21700 [Heyndrickxia sporothermodurans]|nr:hypothetical protein J6TS2_21700 [Heyndrickxia sporothermodurans]
MKRLLTLIVTFIIMFVLTIPTSAQQFEYPVNQDKSFVNENKFYQTLNKDEFQEFQDATYSIRRKTSYKETPNAIMTFEKKTGRYFGQPKQELASSIHPERQVYFFASFVQTKDTEHWKHTIIDAETKRPLEGGSSFKRYENPNK